MSSPILSSRRPRSEDAAAAGRSRRPWTAAAGAGYVVLSFTGLAVAPLPDLGAARPVIQQFVTTAAPGRYVAGGCADLLAYALLIAFAVGLVRDVRSGRGQGAARLAAAGAVLATASVTAGLALVAGVVLGTAVPLAVAQALLTAGSVATWLSVGGIALMLAGVAALGREGTGLPTWMCGAAAVLAVALAAAPPLAESSVAHIPATAMYLWVLVASALVLRRGPAARR